MENTDKYNSLTNKLVNIVDAKIRLDFPEPHCSRKKALWRMEVQTIKKQLAEKLYQGGINISVKID